MKKILLFFVVLTAAQISFGQVLEKNAPASESPSDCPAGYCPYGQYTITTFNFHKPRTGCVSGFGLCIKGDWSSGCRPCRSFRTTSVTKIENGKAICYGEVVNGKLEFRIPAAIRTDQNFSSHEMSTFTIDKAALTIYNDGKKKVSKEGVYPVTLSGDEYIVLIDLE